MCQWCTKRRSIDVHQRPSACISIAVGAGSYLPLHTKPVAPRILPAAPQPWTGPPRRQRPYVRNAAVPRRFERHSLIDARRPNSLPGPAGFEPVHQKSEPLTRPASESRCASSSPAPGLRVLVNSDFEMQRFESRPLGGEVGESHKMQMFESCRPSQPVRSPTPRMLMSKCELGVGACVRTLVPLDDALELLAQYPGEA
jgi:hypothetical protein